MKNVIGKKIKIVEEVGFDIVTIFEDDSIFVISPGRTECLSWSYYDSIEKVDIWIKDDIKKTINKHESYI